MSVLEDVDVVEWWNGPVIVFATVNAKRMFAIAVAEQPEGELWLFTPVSPEEEERLNAGTMQLRDAFTKPCRVFFTDVVNEALTNINEFDSSELTDDVLPFPDICLAPRKSNDRLR